MVIRGVRMFSGWPDEEAAQGGLRRVHRLCGLTLGGDDLLDGGEFDGQDFNQRRQSASYLRLVAMNGQRTDLQDQSVNRSGVGQSVSSCARQVSQ